MPPYAFRYHLPLCSQRMVPGTKMYLDSNDLSDLSTLFSEGIHKSEVIILVRVHGLHAARDAREQRGNRGVRGKAALEHLVRVRIRVRVRARVRVRVRVSLRVRVMVRVQFRVRLRLGSD